MTEQKILIIEDDKDISEIIAVYLSKNGFDCQQAFDGNEALRMAREVEPSLLILDVQLPGRDGVDICQVLRQETDIPILFLSCLGEEQDKIRGLDAGGDDYITKPFSLAELLARVNAALRRSGLPDTSVTRKQVLEFPGLKIDLAESLAWLGGRALDLTQLEFQVLVRLARNPGWPFTSEQLFSLIWGEKCIDTRTVAVHINRLRKKLEQNEGKREYILTVWGKGYKFNNQL
ncbi:response regulator transcription factor [Sporomusa sp. KB1]|jgi:two-component system response regulator VicR|uniref:response regulator transcription factor n=1 Tax=Sporomusa sp. KB1 TaxID=943346 RepID=UPI0011A9C3E6|nr:response regulator transcription factor [Sporomusa sp. KB1]TWH49541.1 two-component system response regulator VicR [Sporomusa sp. KB1]